MNFYFTLFTKNMLVGAYANREDITQQQKRKNFQSKTFLIKTCAENRNALACV